MFGNSSASSRAPHHEGAELGDDAELKNAAIKIQAAYRGKRTRADIVAERKHREAHAAEDGDVEMAKLGTLAQAEKQRGREWAQEKMRESSSDLERSNYETLLQHWKSTPPYCRCWPESTLPIRIKLYLLLDEPTSSCAAQILSTFITICIAVSIAFMMVETMPAVASVDPMFWFAFETTFTVIFSLEYVTRLLVCDMYPGRTVLRWLISPPNVVDLAAILPYFITIMMSGSGAAKALGVVRVIRLVRLLRVFKLGKHSAGLKLMSVALRNSLQALGILVFFLALGCVLFSSLIYHVEKLACPHFDALKAIQISANYSKYDEYQAQCFNLVEYDLYSEHGLCCTEFGAPVDFPSVISAFWWTVVTMTTVGFGDVRPRTEGGKFVGAITMLCGILLLALPIALIGSKFQEAYAAELDSSGAEKGKFHYPGQEEGSHLRAMSHRLRLMKFKDKTSSRLARTLSKDLDEIYAIDCDIAMFEEKEREMQARALDRYKVIVERFQKFSDKAMMTRNMQKLKKFAAENRPPDSHEESIEEAVGDKVVQMFSAEAAEMNVEEVLPEQPRSRPQSRQQPEEVHAAQQRSRPQSRQQPEAQEAAAAGLPGSVALSDESVEDL